MTIFLIHCRGPHCWVIETQKGGGLTEIVATHDKATCPELARIRKIRDLARTAPRTDCCGRFRSPADIQALDAPSGPNGRKDRLVCRPGRGCKSETPPLGGGTPGAP